MFFYQRSNKQHSYLRSEILRSQVTGIEEYLKNLPLISGLTVDQFFGRTSEPDCLRFFLPMIKKQDSYIRSEILRSQLYSERVYFGAYANIHTTECKYFAVIVNGIFIFLLGRLSKTT